MTSITHGPGESAASNFDEHLTVLTLPPGEPAGTKNIRGDANPRTSLPLELLEAADEKWPALDDGRPPEGSESRLANGSSARGEASRGRRKDGPSSREGSPADNLVAMATGGDVVLFTDQFGEPHAHVRVADTWRTCKLRGPEFREWLAQRLWQAEERACGSDMMGAAVNTLSGHARYHGERITLESRVAGRDGAVWYDLCDEQGRAVRVTAEGWEVVERPPILFRRFAHQLPQVEPIRGSLPLTALLPLTNLAKPEWGPLLLVYLVTCFLPNIPHPVAVFHGPQGAAKSTLCKLLRRLVDPSALDVLSLVGVEHLPQVLFHHWFVPFDNVGSLTAEASNVLCRAVTGDGLSRRRLYSDDEDVIYHFRRCLCLNGISLTAEKPDLLDRCILFPLERLGETQRREERLVLEEFETMRAQLLGAVFDALSGAMRRYPGVSLAGLPRMADFARWGFAVAEEIGAGGERFLDLYRDNMQEQYEEAIAANPVAAAVIEFLSGREGWGGTPSELLRELEDLGGRGRRKGFLGLPMRPNALTKQLSFMRTSLAQAGIEVEMVRRHGGRRWIALRTTPREWPAPNPSGELPGGSGDDPSGPATRGPAPLPRLLEAKGDDGDDRDDRPRSRRGGPSQKTR